MEIIWDEEQRHLGREPVAALCPGMGTGGTGTAGCCLSPKHQQRVEQLKRVGWEEELISRRGTALMGITKHSTPFPPCWMEGWIKPQSFPLLWFYSAVTGREHIRDEVDHYVLILSAVEQSLLIPNSTIVWHISLWVSYSSIFFPSVSTNRNCFVVKLNFTLDWIEICLFPF